MANNNASANDAPAIFRNEQNHMDGFRVLRNRTINISHNADNGNDSDTGDNLPNRNNDVQQEALPQRENINNEEQEHHEDMEVDNYEVIDGAQPIVDQPSRRLRPSLEEPREENGNEEMLIAPPVINEDMIDEKVEEIMKKIATNNWNPVTQLANRRHSLRPASYMNKAYNSSASALLTHCGQTNCHSSCVTSVNFSPTGKYFLSSSDDRSIAVHETASLKKIICYDTEHSCSIAQAKFLPESNTNIVSASRHGKILLDDISKLKCGRPMSNTVMCNEGRIPASISVSNDRPREVLACFADSNIYDIDIRCEYARINRIASCVDANGNPLRLTHIIDSPRPDSTFSVAGGDQYIRSFDRRMNKCFCQYKPSSMVNSLNLKEVTSIKYSTNGDSILASYNNEDIYLFSADSSNFASETHKYTGHSNLMGAQAVSFYGLRSQYVMSGSDSGHIYIWDRHTEGLRNCIPARNDTGACVLEVHPTEPILATGNYTTSEVNLFSWSPVAEVMPTPKLRNTVRSNLCAKGMQPFVPGSFSLDVTSRLWSDQPEDFDLEPRVELNYQPMAPYPEHQAENSNCVLM